MSFRFARPLREFSTVPGPPGWRGTPAAGWHWPTNWARSRAPKAADVTVSPHLAPRQRRMGRLRPIGAARAKDITIREDVDLMTAGIVYSARLRRVATCITALSTLALGTSLALAQAQPQPAPQVPAPKATPRPAPPKQQQKQPQQQPAQQ